MREFPQLTWDRELEEDVRRLVQAAMAEDWGSLGDITSAAVLPERATGRAKMVSRQEGIVAGLPAVPVTLQEMGFKIHWEPFLKDGERVSRGAVVGELMGAAREILAAERILLNFLGKLSGIATLTGQYVAAVAQTRARIYDTRKTTPGWRRLEKYAVRCGGGTNHRLGLHAAILIKDNHLAWLAETTQAERKCAAQLAVHRAKKYCETVLRRPMLIEIEVDDLDQLEAVLLARPDVVLLDNMTIEQLRTAVALRNAVAPEVELEASGGINLDNVRQVAETGVDRISIGALTHHAGWLDIGLDWD